MAQSISDNQILEAALETIVQHGYAGATTRQIAAAAGINEVTLFRRFGSKKNLLAAAVEQEAANFVAASIEYTGDVEADLLRVVLFYQALIQHRGRLIAMLLTEVPRQPELLDLLQTPLTIIGQISAMIGRYQREGVLAQEPPMQAFAALVGPLLVGWAIGSLQPAIGEQTFDPIEHVRRYLHGRTIG